MTRISIGIEVLATLIGAVVGLIVAHYLGDTAIGTAVAAVTIACFVGFAKFLVVWLPEKSHRIRRRLDPRSVHVGVWLQVVESSDGLNDFGLYEVTFDGPRSFAVSGLAYDKQGRYAAKWNSTEEPTFSRNGQKMSYVWEGYTTVATQGGSEPRHGLAAIDLQNRTGEVHHIARDRLLIVHVLPVTDDSLRGYPGAPLESLSERQAVDAFATAFAQTRNTE